MRNLGARLQEWTTKGFISPDQASRIRQHEAGRNEGSWILGGLILLGLSVISFGLVSLISANWNQIPNSIKLFGDLALLLASAFAVVKAWDTQSWVWFEGLLFFFTMTCLASIGLIAQIFNTTGEPYQALLFWTLITTGVAFASRRSFVSLVWTASLLTGLTWALADAATFKFLLFDRHPYPIAMTVSLMAGALTVLCQIVSGSNGPTFAFRLWTVVLGAASLVVVEAFNGETQISLRPFMPGYALAAIVAVGILASAQYRQSQKILLLLTLGVYLVAFHGPFLGLSSSLAYAGFTIAVLGLWALFLASLKSRRLFQWVLFLIGLRFLVVYFQALGGLALGGLGLVISGLLIIFTAYMWSTYRKSLASWAEDVLQ